MYFLTAHDLTCLKLTCIILNLKIRVDGEQTCHLTDSRIITVLETAGHDMNIDLNNNIKILSLKLQT